MHCSCSGNCGHLQCILLSEKLRESLTEAGLVSALRGAVLKASSGVMLGEAFYMISLSSCREREIVERKLPHGKNFIFHGN